MVFFLLSSCPRYLHWVNKVTTLAFYRRGCCVHIPLPDNNDSSLSIRVQCPYLWWVLRPYPITRQQWYFSLYPRPVSTSWRALCPYPFTGQQHFSLLNASVFQFPYPPPIPFSCLVSFGTIAPVKNKLFSLPRGLIEETKCM